MGLAHEPSTCRNGELPVSTDLVLVAASGDFAELEERIQAAKRLYREAKVLVLGVANARNDILGCIEAGASAYTLSDASLSEVLGTMRSVHAGGMVCPPEVAGYLFERLASIKREMGASQPSKLDQFTRREAQILQLVADGLSNKEIASLLGLELQTVKNYVHNILEKLRVQNRRAAASVARSEGLVETAQRPQ